jgi:outer membrane protein OmpA-like peptidoglycan-associated protein
MDKINYEYNQSTLNQSAVRHLDAVYELLNRYPNMSIELIVHTDTRGDAAKNLTLSQVRAANAKTYLEYRGINGKRIKTTGKGESKPRNRCLDGVECSETEHAVNSRMEIVVLGD